MEIEPVAWEYKHESMHAGEVALFLGCGTNATSWELVTAWQLENFVTLIFKRPVKVPDGCTITVGDELEFPVLEIEEGCRTCSHGPEGNNEPA